MRLVRRDVQPQHVVECRRVPCACVPFDVRAVDHAPWRRNTTRAVMSWSRAVYPRPFQTHDTDFHSALLSSCTSRTVPAYCASSRSQTHKPHHHGLRRHDYVDPDVEPECGSCLTRRVYFAFASSCKYDLGEKP